MIIVSFHSFYRFELDCKQLEIIKDEVTINELLKICEKTLGIPFVDKLLDESAEGRIHRPMILVNGRNINLLLGFQTIVRKGDRVALLPPCAGG